MLWDFFSYTAVEHLYIFPLYAYLRGGLVTYVHEFHACMEALAHKSLSILDSSANAKEQNTMVNDAKIDVLENRPPTHPMSASKFKNSTLTSNFYDD